MYSLGEKIDSLLPHFKKAVINLDNSYLCEEFSPAHSMWGNYEALLKIVSLGILLETDDDIMRKIADAMYYHNMDDALIDLEPHSTSTRGRDSMGKSQKLSLMWCLR